jgi:thiosulfate/3-mercaptopyruvate sulfurtransferase
LFVEMTRSIDPIVSTGWLEAQLARDGLIGSGQTGGGQVAGGLVIIDVRETHLYEAGHISRAISVPFSPVSAWATSTDELLMELPEEVDLFQVVGDCGLGPDSRVVIVTTLDKAPSPPYSLADATRVAATLFYAGVDNVAILDGGHPKWVREDRETTTAVPEISPVNYRGTVRRKMFVSTEYVRDHIGRPRIIDGRDPDQYFGATIDPFAGKAGHIPTARSLPAVWMWEADGTYKPVELLAQMAAGVIDQSRDEEIIVYCGVGGYASSWWFVLTQLLGYANVKIYDGAAEAWAKEDAMVLYSWTS